jgi:exopolysaccharide biosynthesis predicted pyruvyltransferase EpsI
MPRDFRADAPDEVDVREHLLRECGDMACDLLRFPGNYGDAAIWHGTRRILESCGVAFASIQCTDAPSREILIVDGGGNLVDLYDDVRAYLDAFGGRYRRVIILPHTIAGPESLAAVRRLGRRAIVFCRERVSYGETRRAAPDAEVFLWHDCAFFADLARIRAAEPGSTLVAYRTDREAEPGRAPAPPDNRDLSLEGYAMSSLDHMLGVLSSVERVVTDRLHIAIVAAQIGCRVVLRANSYFKNRAVFEYSLSRYSNVRFRA